MFKLESTVIGNYSLEKSIGEGTFGKVHLGIHLITGEKVISTKTKGCDKNPWEDKDKRWGLNWKGK